MSCMNKDILAKQHLQYVRTYLRFYLEHIDELLEKITKAKKEYEHKQDEKLYLKLDDLVHEKKTMEYLFEHEIFITRTLSSQDSIIDECDDLYRQYMSKGGYKDMKIEKKSWHAPIKKAKPGQLVKKTLANYVVVDLETTGLNSETDKIIEVGILKVRDHQIVETYQQLVNPQKKISSTITNLTGITNEMVAGQPTIKEIRQKIKNMIEDEPILGHHVLFDIQFLKKACGPLNNDYLDTLHYAKKAFYGSDNYQLSTLVKIFSLTNNEHRALADCIATKELYDLIVEKFQGIENLYKDEINNRQNRLDLYILKRAHIEGQFQNRNCIITGNLKKVSRKTANELILKAGGTVQKSVNKKVNVVIVGVNPYGPHATAKHLKALERIEQGQKIDIIEENEFYRLFGL